MSKKIQSVLSVALILLCGLCLFTSCSTQKLDFFTNIGDSLDPVAKLVRAMHGWIGNYGWTVVVYGVPQGGNVAAGFLATLRQPQSNS